ncbi:4'-phosphopantetheinyl transferase superfamily protein [Aliiglaciecola sp. LCG003]|uniref:4'-phosphopantetheinyl transferase family protein n=1 Tax=Aliiglaciecola sp. LCG003 TaxID=3053655 RepID=UPI002572A4E9|nr:4'-phosphopantetheinyl transferase superfamily protein [Aliiglaciecola sp. LCG003]WJG11198.1 4'-phosphopantetheinyl transferase superfamily protein [Aliiglaciecola sp. LCG003]
MPISNPAKVKNATDPFLYIKKIIPFDLMQSVVFYQCDFFVQHYQQHLFSLYQVDFPSSLKNAVPKRQAEYLAGRYAAKQVLKNKGAIFTGVKIGADRSPVWPRGIIGSISHNHSTAVCAAAFTKEVQCLGIDLEDWISPSVVKEIKSGVVKPDEEKLLHASSLGFDKAFTLAFSAKESLFKALYPLVGYYFDFDAAQLIEINESENKLSMTLRKDLTPDLPAGTCLNGYYCWNAERVLTLIEKSAEEYE